MNDYVIADVSEGIVQCPSGKSEEIDKCRFCAHSVYFEINGERVKSPARAYCSRCKDATCEVNLKKVQKVICDDIHGEGFRSIMNIIS